MPFTLWFTPYEYALDSNKRIDAGSNDPMSDLTIPANCLYPNRVRRGVYAKLKDVYSGEFGIGEIPVPFYGPNSGGDGDRELQGELVKALKSSREKFTLSPELLLDGLLLDEAQLGLGQGVVSTMKLHIDGWVDAVCVSLLRSCSPPAFLQVGIRCALVEGISCAVLAWLSKKKASDLSLRLLYKWFYGETETAKSSGVQRREEPAMAGSPGSSNFRVIPMRIGFNRLVISSCSESVNAVTPDGVRDGLRVKVKARTVDQAVDVLRTLHKRSSYSSPESGNNATELVCESNSEFLFCKSSHWVRLDVDAKFSLSELEAACTKAGQLELLDLIDYVEDPILYSFNELPQGNSATRIRVALDVGRRTEQFSEVVKGSQTVQGNAGQYAGQFELPRDVLVVKPHLFPISEAAKVGKGGVLSDVLSDGWTHPISKPVGSSSIVVSCTWESGIGLAHLALIASAVSAPATVHGVYAFPGRRYCAKNDGSYRASFCESVTARFVESCQMSSIDKACSIDLIQCEKLLLETDFDEQVIT